MTNHLYKGDLPDDVKFSGSVAVDTEAMGLNNLRDRLCVVQLSSGDGHSHVVHFNKDEFDCPNIKKLMEDSSVTKIFHFARFDVAIIKQYLGVNTNSVYCTKIASKLIRTYTNNHGLKDLCSEILERKLSKQQQSSDWGANKLTKDQVNYAASDVLYLHKLRERLDEMLERESRKEMAYKCFDFLQTRAELDLAGWIEDDIFAHSWK